MADPVPEPRALQEVLSRKERNLLLKRSKALLVPRESRGTIYWKCLCLLYLAPKTVTLREQVCGIPNKNNDHDYSKEYT